MKCRICREGFPDIVAHANIDTFAVSCRYGTQEDVILTVDVCKACAEFLTRCAAIALLNMAFPHRTGSPRTTD